VGSEQTAVSVALLAADLGGEERPGATIGRGYDLGHPLFPDTVGPPGTVVVDAENLVGRLGHFGRRRNLWRGGPGCFLREHRTWAEPGEQRAEHQHPKRKTDHLKASQRAGTLAWVWAKARTSIYPTGRQKRPDSCGTKSLRGQ